MSACKEVVIELTKEQQEKIKKSLNRDVTHIKCWLVPGAVVLAEVIQLPEKFNAG